MPVNVGTASPEFIAMIEHAERDSGFRGKLIWFPEKVVSHFNLEGASADAVLEGSLEGLRFDDPDMAYRAGLVFNIHDLHSGE